MAVQSAAGAGRDGQVYAVDGGESVDRNARTKGEAAVIAARAERCGDVLRAVVDGMRIRGMRRGQRSRVGTSADRLVIDTGGLAGTLRREPRVTVIVGEGEFAGDAVKLGRESAIGPAEMAVVGEEDGIEADTREGRALVVPEGRRRCDGIVERDAQSVIASLNEDLAGFPVDPDRGLASTVCAGSRRSHRRRDAAWRLLGACAIRRGRIVHEGGKAGSGRRRWRSGGARSHSHRDNHVSGRRNWDESGNGANVPETGYGIRERQVFFAGAGGGVIGRTGAVVSGIGTDGEDIEIGGHGGGPGVFECDLGGHRLVERGGRGGQDDVQVVVVAHSGRADVLNADVGDRASADRSKIPSQRTGAAVNRADGWCGCLRKGRCRSAGQEQDRRCEEEKGEGQED